jgi:hypothetical protein
MSTANGEQNDGATSLVLLDCHVQEPHYDQVSAGPHRRTYCPGRLSRFFFRSPPTESGLDPSAPRLQHSKLVESR